MQELLCLGHENVSLLERCPQLRGVLIEGFHGITSTIHVLSRCLHQFPGDFQFVIIMLDSLCQQLCCSGG